jgi:hypothetical protein
MKRLLDLLVLFSLFFFLRTAVAQELKVVTLDMDNDLLVSPSRVVLNAGDSLQFNSINGDFAIYIIDAVRYFDIDEADLDIRINSAVKPFSDAYKVRGNDEVIEITYSVYCITNNSWPDAPPRIIIVSQ